MEKSKLTKREAIRECKRLWKENKASGLSKCEFLRSEAGKRWLEKDYRSDCPLCEYSNPYTCRACPLFVQYGQGCHACGFEEDIRPTYRWMAAVMGLRE